MFPVNLTFRWPWRQWSNHHNKHKSTGGSWRPDHRPGQWSNHHDKHISTGGSWSNHHKKHKSTGGSWRPNHRPGQWSNHHNKLKSTGSSWRPDQRYSLKIKIRKMSLLGLSITGCVVWSCWVFWGGGWYFRKCGQWTKLVLPDFTKLIKEKRVSKAYKADF